MKEGRTSVQNRMPMPPVVAPKDGPYAKGATKAALKKHKNLLKGLQQQHHANPTLSSQGNRDSSETFINKFFGTGKAADGA